jgi:hypothetical protein
LAPMQPLVQVRRPWSVQPVWPLRERQLAPVQQLAQRTRRPTSERRARTRLALAMEEWTCQCLLSDFVIENDQHVPVEHRLFGSIGLPALAMRAISNPNLRQSLLI